jgi:hypothetical protein
MGVYIVYVNSSRPYGSFSSMVSMTVSPRLITRPWGDSPPHAGSPAGHLNPLFAALAMGASSLLVVTNSSRSLLD